MRDAFVHFVQFPLRLAETTVSMCNRILKFAIVIYRLGCVHAKLLAPFIHSICMTKFINVKKLQSTYEQLRPVHISLPTFSFKLLIEVKYSTSFLSVLSICVYEGGWEREAILTTIRKCIEIAVSFVSVLHIEWFLSAKHLRWSMKKMKE